MTNAELKAKYNELHAQGPSSWFSDGHEERKAIIDMGEPWRGKSVLEIGCGEGDLGAMLAIAGAQVSAVDYSQEASKAWERYNIPGLEFALTSYRSGEFYAESRPHPYDVIVMQGVLEHMDKPFEELAWIIKAYLKEGGTVVTSSPGFLNPRGYVWMTLALLLDVPMSLTDLHFLNPWEFGEFCDKHKYKVATRSCDFDWGWGPAMIEDFGDRLPKALKDAGLNTLKVNRLLAWLDNAKNLVIPPAMQIDVLGATIVYRIET